MLQVWCFPLQTVFAINTDMMKEWLQMLIRKEKAGMLGNVWNCQHWTMKNTGKL
jgi:hypothetical protein